MAEVCIGYWLSDKKKQKLNFPEFLELCSKQGIRAVQLDLNRCLEDQGPFDLIVHKVVEENYECQEGGAQRLEDYLLAHPETIAIDPIEATNVLGNRDSMYTILEQSDICSRGDSKVFVPNFTALHSRDAESNRKALTQAGVTYPCVCKPLDADDPEKSHHMQILYGEHCLKDVEPPCVAQSLVQHDGILYKIFVVGESHFIVERPSLKNLYAGDQPTEYFHSHDVSKTWSNSHLIGTERNPGSPCMAPDDSLMKEIMLSVCRRTQLNLIGIDVIVDKHTGRYGLIDVNPFPGYDGFPEFWNVVLQNSLRMISKQRQVKAEHKQFDKTPNHPKHPYEGENHFIPNTKLVTHVTEGTPTNKTTSYDSNELLMGSTKLASSNKPDPTPH